jgi:hypothetical protein
VGCALTSVRRWLTHSVMACMGEEFLLVCTWRVRCFGGWEGGESNTCQCQRSTKECGSCLTQKGCAKNKP